jgi:hypothetical protein
MACHMENRPEAEVEIQQQAPNSREAIRWHSSTPRGFAASNMCGALGPVILSSIHIHLDSVVRQTATMQEPFSAP